MPETEHVTWLEGDPIGSRHLHGCVPARGSRHGVLPDQLVVVARGLAPDARLEGLAECAVEDPSFDPAITVELGGVDDVQTVCGVRDDTIFN